MKQPRAIAIKTSKESLVLAPEDETFGSFSPKKEEELDLITIQTGDALFFPSGSVCMSRYLLPEDGEAFFSFPREFFVSLVIYLDTKYSV